MSAMASDRSGFHRRRIQRSARSVSWVLAPFFFLSIAVWLLFNAIFCSEGNGVSVTVLRMCSHAHLLPDLFALLILLSLGWLLFTLGGFGHELITDKPVEGGRKALDRMRRARDGYRYLDDESRAIVSFAREMALWAAALVLCTWVFYSLELAFPLGLLTIAACVTIVYRVYRRLRGFSPPRSNQPPTVGPEPVGGPSTTEQRQESDLAYPEKLKQTERDLLQRTSGRWPGINHIGLLMIAACATIVYRLYRRLRGFSRPRSNQSPTLGPEPTGGPTTTEQTRETDPAYPEKLRQTERDLLRRRSGRGPNINHTVGFGLSGGGIRSATFCLGVFQGLAKKRLLSKIDYLSTVSGGGYFGAFYGRLFTRAEVTTLMDVEEILVARPASATQGMPAAGKLPKGKVFRWLRENGRYLAPSGSGDVLLAGAAMLRNFIAVQLVLATFILMIFVAAQLIRGGVEVACQVGQGGQCGRWWGELQNILTNHLPGGKGGIWWSPYTAFVPVLFLFFAIPPGWCYWLVEKPNRGTAGRWIPPFYGWLAAVVLSLPGSVIGICGRLDLAMGACRFGGIASKSELLTKIGSMLDANIPFIISILVLFVALETLIWGLFSGYVPRIAFQKDAPNEKLIFDDERVRLRLSLQLKTALIATGIAFAFVVIDSLAQTFYGAALMGKFRPKIWLTAVLGPLIGLAGFGRTIVSSFGGKTAGKRFSIPLNLVAGAAAFVLVALLLITLDTTSYLIAWKSKMPLGPRPDWTMIQRVNEAKQLEVTRLPVDTAKPQNCPNEAIGPVTRVDANTRTLTVKTRDTELNLTAKSNAVVAWEKIKVGETVRALYGKKDGKMDASSISVVTPESNSAANEGWQISAGKPKPEKFDCGSRESLVELVPAGGALLITLIFSVLFGWSWPFLNRSTHQSIYTSRLIRAYLGASNLVRLVATGKSVTQAISGDDIKQEDYWPRFSWLANRSDRDAEKTDRLLQKIHADEDRLLKKGMPLHLVNVTINETLDARRQVEQRDRKGIGMAVGPAAISVGVVHHLVVATEPDPQRQRLEAEVYPPEGKDGAYRIFRYARSPWTGRLDYTGEFLTLGNWTGISGAAFSTSLGWRTSLAFSLLAGLANVRLTYWWNSGVKPFDRFTTRVALAGKMVKQKIVSAFRKTPPAAAADMDSFPESRRSWLYRWLSSAFRWLFAVQSFLFDELLARFRGTAPQWWPLSDGGHFENLGGYELIRRRLPVIVIIDAEADLDYTFEGLSNLVRKARLDFGAEIQFLTEEQLDEAVHPDIRKHFGTLEQLRRGIWIEEPVEDPNDPEAGKPPETVNGGRKVRRRRTISPVNIEALSLAHAALAHIIYDDDVKPTSTLLYIKPTLIGDESADVHRYHTEHPSFPHESTLQQFFDEAQWESYRKLGEDIALKLFQEPPAITQGKLFPYRLLAPAST